MASVLLIAHHAHRLIGGRTPALAALLAVVILFCLSGPASCQTWTAGSGGAIYYNGGNVGVGTSSPRSPFDAVGNSSGSSVVSVQNSNVSGYSSLNFYDSSGALKAYFGYGNSSSAAPFAGNVYFGTGVGSSASFLISPQQVEAFRITSAGNVGIGTTNPQYKLAVSGTIQAKEVLVNTGWSDYVFASGYRLRPLTELKAYVEQNHHLPDIPSAKEVAEKGVSLGEMEAKLLAKVEELTLHVIQADERNTRLEQQNRELQERLARIEAREQR